MPRTPSRSTLCTSASEPYSCTWSTRAIPDGSYFRRAITTDRAGYATGSTMVWTPCANGTDVDGFPSSVAPANELGPIDREF